MDINIKTARYENIYFDCPFCNCENVLNRTSDLGGNNVIARHDGVVCEKCKKTFSIIGDRITSATYEWFINELIILKKKKTYRAYVLNLCQGLEAFFYQAIINKKFDRNPDFRDEDDIVVLEKYEDDNIRLEGYKDKRKEYDEIIKEWTFKRMRDEFLTIFKKEQENYLPRGELKPKEDKRYECFDLIKNTDINVLRNKVVHKHAYRPSLEEINKYACLVDAIYWLGLYLDVEHSTNHINRPTKLA